ncbi:hypothetical protein ACFL3B_05505 [Gemmatimonadota bacterium]
MKTEKQDYTDTPLWLSIVLWIAAAVLMFGAAGYQERTGPTKELRGDFHVGGVPYHYELIRSGDSREDAPVVIPSAGNDVNAVVNFRRYPTDDEFTSIPFERTGEEMVAALPRQPSAGKLEYSIVIATPGGELRIPESTDENVIIRFKDPVPIGVLVPHIVMMFFALLIGMRTALSAILGLHDTRNLAWVTLGLMTVGGLILGPVVQKYAFGAFWTGVPFGYDLTDNKTLIMWVVWAGVCGLFVWRRAKGVRLERVAVTLAAVVMVVVYLIPHSLRGSELDYEALDEGAPASEAVRTGQPG